MFWANFNSTPKKKRIFATNLILVNGLPNLDVH